MGAFGVAAGTLVLESEARAAASASTGAGIASISTFGAAVSSQVAVDWVTDVSPVRR